MNRMRMHEQAMQLKQTEIDEKRRQVDQIEKMIEDFNRMIDNLDHDVEAEHRRTGIYDSENVAYSTLARAAVQRRENLQTSIADLQRQWKKSAAALERSEIELADGKKRIDLDRALYGYEIASN